MNSSKFMPTIGQFQFIATIQLFILALLSLASLYGLFDFHLKTLIYSACIALVTIFIWSLWSWQILTKNLFDPYILFFISATMFNGGLAFLEVFKLNANGILDNKFSSGTVLNALFIVILSLASLHTGGLLSLATSQVKKLQTKPKQNSFVSIIKCCYLIGLFLLIISLFPTISVFKEAILTVWYSGYGALYEQETTTGIGAAAKLLSNFIIPSSLFLLVGSKNKPKVRAMSLIIIIMYSVALFFLGARGKAVMPLIAYAWLWHCWICPLPGTIILCSGTIMLALVFPLVKVIRNVSGQDRFSFSYLWESFSSIDNPFIAILTEMGTSMQTVAYTLELVPSHRSFDMGVGYFYSLLTLIPNFSGGLHPAIARGTPSNWLDWTVNPGMAALNRSLGFSFIAEAYLNFGWFGIPIILGIIGFLLGKFTLWAVRSGEPAKLAMIASFTAFFLFYARSESVREVRLWIWYSFIPYLGVYALSLLRSKSLKKS